MLSLLILTSACMEEKDFINVEILMNANGPYKPSAALLCINISRAVSYLVSIACVQIERE